jgi:hypothetical protein
MKSKEEIIKNIKSFINAIEIYGTIDYKCIPNLYEPVVGLLDLYQKEKEKNKALEYIENKLMPLAECGYWNYKNHTCTHTCRGCDSLHENNRRTDTGILIDKDRYCRLYEDGDFKEDTKMVSVNDLIARHWKGSNNGKQM